MNITVRPLEQNDFSLLKTKLEECASFQFANSKASMDRDAYIKYSLDLFSTDRHIIHGCFHDGDLTSIVASQELKIIPSYIIKNYKVLTPATYFSPKKNGWNQLLTSVIEYFESKGVYSFYAMQGADEKRNYNMRKSVKILQNYEYTIEERVPSNTRSKYGLHDQTMYYGKTMTIDTIVNHYACRQEYRKI